MNVQVRYLAQLRLAVGRTADSVECSAGATVAQLLHLLARRENRLRPILLTAEGEVKPSLLIFLGERQVNRDHSLHDGDEVTLMTPIAGGA